MACLLPWPIFLLILLPGMGGQYGIKIEKLKEKI
jgi:hypothetical protein